MTPDNTTNSERVWRAMDVSTGRMAPVDGPDLLVFSKSEEDAIDIIERAFDQGVLFRQGVTDISKLGRCINDIAEASPMEWLTAIKSPNIALWEDSDADDNKIIQKMGRDEARSLQTNTNLTNITQNNDSEQ